jgi:fructose-1,6-bisphosphatase II
VLLIDVLSGYGPEPLSLASVTPVPVAQPSSGLDGGLVWHAIAATRAAAVAAARWAGRGDPHGADAAATTAMRAVLGSAPGSGTVVTGEGAKDRAPMLADGERTGAPGGLPFDIAVDPLECTDLCARGLPGALSTIAIAPRGSLWTPGAAFYMEKLVLPPAARDAADLTDAPEAVVAQVAEALGRPAGDVRVVVLDKPRHRELVDRLRLAGARVAVPSAGDVAGALEVVLPDGGADVLLGIGGAPEGVLTACAVRALGGFMQGRLAPQRDDERRALEASGAGLDAVLSLDDLASEDAVFVATGVTGGLLAAPRHHDGRVTTETLVIATGTVHRMQTTTQE